MLVPLFLRRPVGGGINESRAVLRRRGATVVVVGGDSRTDPRTFGEEESHDYASKSPMRQRLCSLPTLSSSSVPTSESAICVTASGRLRFRQRRPEDKLLLGTPES
nr:hypothetical protein Iba_scaffold11831CG0010 [Ipomoea batatas]GME11527.1 hypothetical protein Iba_scaffold11832CG0010 [Ipomoea batatas]GME19871.1 hypothetical protein Iba_scaffold24013CG0040 [Ipomoea batatas]